MKKKFTAVKILLPFIVLFAAAAVFFGVKLYKTDSTLRDKQDQQIKIEAIPRAQKLSTEKARKTQAAFDESISDTENKKAFAEYIYNKIVFTSYSEAWDEKNLEALCGELLQNIHGSELDYLAEVIVYGESDEEILGLHESTEMPIDIPIRLFKLTPSIFTYSLPNNMSVLSLQNGDEYTTPEQMAITLSHEYGHHFTLYYFKLEGDDAEIENDAYFETRYIDGLGIRYKSEDMDDWDEYLENHMWYLIEIAAEDYVYLMGSPNTKRTMEYLDTLDILKLGVNGKDDKVDEYYDLASQNFFNSSPHENAAIPLPQYVEGLPELFYGAINMDAPDLPAVSEAQDINIKVSRRTKYEKSYYSISWDKPWGTDDVIYTLVAYDENDNLLGPIKSIKGDESAKAYIGSVPYSRGNSYYWYDSDGWTDEGFLRLRIIVTFSDGTAAVSPAVDRSFR